MARLTRFSVTLILILVPAAPVIAADTGMLYVKSFPSGAVVVIEGKERGKTPVLVRSLPAGDVTVELRFPGVKPVTKQATVKANKVVTIDVAIELPSATLTIVSEPLEATVFLDGRDAGKTPLTLEDLQPGEHRLILLKDGHARTARTVVLKPGSERVLEVKLGTAGGDEAVRPAAGREAAKAHAPGRVPVEVQLILTMLKETVDKCNYAETRRNLALALKQPDMADFKEELCAAIRVVQALEAREDAIRDGAEALVGKEVVLKTRTGARKGKVEGVSVEGITMASKIIIDGRAVGQTRATVKWSALAPGEQDRLAGSWKPEGLDGAVARAVLAFARKDKAGAERAATAAGDHALGKYLGAGSAAGGPAEDDPKEAWAPLEKRCSARRITAAEEMALDREIRAFKARYGKAGLDSSLRRRVRLAAERAKRASGLVGHWAFDEGKGAVARDSSGCGNDGRIHGTTWTKGKIVRCLDFDGVDDHVACGSRLGAALGGQCTLAAWVKMATTERRWVDILATKANWRHASGYVLQVNPADRHITVIGGGTDCALATVSWDTSWHHVAATVVGRTACIYFDGVVMTTDRSVGPLRPTRAALHIGQQTNGGNSMHGLIDDVRIYIRALSAEEVKALAAQAE